MQCVSNGSAKFWFSDSVSFSKFHTVVPKLILEYGLDLDESVRKKKSDYGEPVWSLVINYDPAKNDVFQFWLFTTGYREARRSKLMLKEILAKNSSMVQKQKLNSILTVKKEKLLRYGNYVLGQYVEFSDLKPQFSKVYYHPEQFGVVFNTKVIRTKTIDSNKTSNYRIFKPFDNFELKRFASINKNFGFAFLENEHTRWNQASVSTFLLQKFGIKFNDEVSYNDRLKELTRALRGVRKKHLEFFQRYSQKKVRFTWYLSKDFIELAERELNKKIDLISTGKADRLKEATYRLSAHGNFHGTRHQIGTLQAKTRSKLNSRDPNQKKLNQMYFPKNLHYVRFTAKKAQNMKEFELLCRNADKIYLNKQSPSRSKTNY
ncbi:hypothetical protein [Acinetobacter sp. BSP-53]|uniref:hypothetical protein n=1 Tax=Acinetobacter sp. BSP-53 TaxID=3344662 RepID=UPI00376F72EB